MTKSNKTKCHREQLHRVAISCGVAIFMEIAARKALLHGKTVRNYGKLENIHKHLKATVIKLSESGVQSGALVGW